MSKVLKELKCQSSTFVSGLKDLEETYRVSKAQLQAGLQGILERIQVEEKRLASLPKLFDRVRITNPGQRYPDIEYYPPFQKIEGFDTHNPGYAQQDEAKGLGGVVVGISSNHGSPVYAVVLDNGWCWYMDGKGLEKI